MPDLTIAPNLSPVQSFADGAAILGTANQLSLGPLRAGDINQFLMGSPIGNLVGQAGMRFAASGGRYTKGILVWKDSAGNIQSFVFQMNPSELSDRTSPRYASQEVPGQNRPQYQFINGGARVLSFTLNFFYSDRQRTAIRDALEQLRGLGMRAVQTSMALTARSGPPVLHFYFGQYYQDFRCGLTGFTVKAFDLFDPQTLLPLQANAEIELTEMVDPLDVVKLAPSKGQSLDLLGIATGSF